MQPDGAAGDGQPQAEAIGAAVPTSVERLEDALQAGRLDARPLVDDVHLQLFPAPHPHRVPVSNGPMPLGAAPHPCASAGQAYYSDRDTDVLGGNILVTGGAEYIFPMPFIKNQSQLRSSVFVDAGNVYSDKSYLPTTQGCGNVDLNPLAVSLGVGVTWYSPMGPLSFSLAAPLKKPDNAETQIFLFSLGQTF
jgi:hypothetical protein